MSDLNAVPSANRIHIGIYGRRNSGKSSLINALTGQPIALVSPVAGTTTDPVRKAMELRGLGACLLIDTAGFDDEGELGSLRTEASRQTLEKVHLGVLVVSAEAADLSLEEEWLARCREKKLPVVVCVNQADRADPAPLAEKIAARWKEEPVLTSALTGEGMDALLAALVRALPEDCAPLSITGPYVKPGDLVMLVMPQDSEAPKGRLILPQVQTIRDLLDNRCLVMGVVPEDMEAALNALKAPPALIITDSQAFPKVAPLTPKESRLTSFSILLAANKGDLAEFIRGAQAVERLTEASKVLIAEACTHAPLSEDIGRVKIPALLRRRTGPGLSIEMVSGPAFPEDLSGYDLIVHCGGCMFHRKYLLSRVERAKAAGVPITNYGVLLAKLNGILDQISM